MNSSTSGKAGVGSSRREKLPLPFQCILIAGRSAISPNELPSRASYAFVREWLDDHKQFSVLTRRNWRRDLGIFAYAAKQGYAVSNPVDGIERPEFSDSEIKVLSIPEASKLLNNADEDARPILAIGLFAGLRMSEILALRWEEVDLCDRTITVQGRKAKTRQRRVVTISDNLHGWLALTPAEEQTGPIWKQGFWGWYNRRLALGVPRNALRHSFGSYHYALHKNENLTAAEMGNSPSMLFRHYRAVAKPQAAKSMLAALTTQPSSKCR